MLDSEDSRPVRCIRDVRSSATMESHCRICTTLMHAHCFDIKGAICSSAVLRRIRDPAGSEALPREVAPCRLTKGRPPASSLADEQRPSGIHDSHGTGTIPCTSDILGLVGFDRRSPPHTSEDDRGVGSNGIDPMDVRISEGSNCSFDCSGHQRTRSFLLSTRQSDPLLEMGFLRGVHPFRGIPFP